jgi:thimet oligopeptidase
LRLAPSQPTSAQSERLRHRQTLVAGVLLAALSVTAMGAAPLKPAPAVAAVPLGVDWTLDPLHISSTCKAEIERANGRITALTRMRSARTFSTVVLPLETILADLNDDTAAQQFLTNVSTDKAVRDASQACNSAESAFYSEVTARPELYEALKAAKASGTAVGDAQTKLTDLWLVASTRAGAGLADAQRTEFVRLSAQLSDVQNQFNANLGNDSSSITISSAQTAGLPSDFTATFKKIAAGYVVPVNESTVQTFMQNATDESARRAFYLAYNNRGGQKNVALLEQAIGIRDRLAHLFGYPNWATYVLADKMAATPARVDSFLAKIDTAILPKAKAERAELVALKGGEPFNNWDTAFYQTQLRKQKYSVDQNAIKQYFPVRHTVDAVLAVYAKLLSVSFKPIGAPNVYNPEVLGYEVHDAGDGVLLGTFYLDLYPRPGKYDHFANFPLVPRRVMPDGTVRAPMSVIVGNWSRPAAGRPALLSHDEVETFFHEFGHNMAAMLADEPYATLTSGFRSDFVEAPSQMLENWVWNPQILKQISANVTSGEPLPDALITKLIAARYVDYALATTQQILYASVDMKYHSAGASVDTTAVWKDSVAALTPNTFVDGTHPQAGFGHLMGGYDAGYYGYLWSKVYAQDMFSAFQSGGLENPAVGERYRTDILAPARTYEPDVEVAAFLGRPMSTTAFYAELGISPQTTMR